MLLEPGQRLPLRLGAVREGEFAEYSAEIRLVEVADVPEHGLVSPVARRHVHGVHDLLEIIVDDLDESTLLEIVLHHLVETGQVVVAIVLPDEVVEIHQELRSGHGSHELGRHRVNKVDELAAEGLEVGRGYGHAAELPEAALEERIHGDGHAVRVAGSSALVVLVENVALKILDVLVGKLPAVHRLDLVLHDVAVLLDVVLLVELLAECHDVLAGDIGIGVELGAGGGVRCLDIVADEVSLLAEVETLVEFLDVGQGNLLVDGHQGLDHLTPDLAA